MLYIMSVIASASLGAFGPLIFAVSAGIFAISSFMAFAAGHAAIQAAGNVDSWASARRAWRAWRRRTDGGKASPLLFMFFIQAGYTSVAACPHWVLASARIDKRNSAMAFVRSA